MKTVFAIFAVSFMTFSAQASTLRCAITQGPSAKMEVVEIAVETTVDENDASTFVRKYEVAQTEEGSLHASLMNLKQQVVLIYSGNKIDSLTISAAGSFANTSLGVNSMVDQNKSLNVSCVVR